MINQGLKMLKRAIDERPKGGMQTGMPKVKLRESDAVRAVTELKWAQQHISELEQREAELSATVERLRSALPEKVVDFVRCGIGGNYGGSKFGEAMDKYHAPLVDALDATPPTNLNAVKREAFIEGFNAGFTDCWIVDEEEHADAAIEIANQSYPD